MGDDHDHDYERIRARTVLAPTRTLYMGVEGRCWWKRRCGLFVWYVLSPAGNGPGRPFLLQYIRHLTKHTTARSGAVCTAVAIAVLQLTKQHESTKHIRGQQSKRARLVMFPPLHALV